jgi:Ca-activated chloride channel family protein
MNLAIVLDRSGSMGHEQKMEQAKSAVRALIDQLLPEDIFSLVMYDHEVDVLRRAARVRDRHDIRALVDEIYPRGSTNLGGGMIEGLRQAEKNASGEYVNRVILLSDGLANQGITSKVELERIANKYRSRGISLTTMGVGLEYNENLMMGLAESGGGNYYFIESSYGLAGMLQKEFHSLSVVLVQDASIGLKLGRGVQVEDIICCPYTIEGDRPIIRIGNLISNDRREITVRLRIPPRCDDETRLLVARGTVYYESSEVRVGRVEPFEVWVNYTRDAAVIEKNRDLDAQARADVAISTRQVENALRLVDEGKREEAEKEMSRAVEFLGNSAATSLESQAGAEVRSQMARLQSYADTLREAKDDTRRAKKAIQYDNYMTQKKR